MASRVCLLSLLISCLVAEASSCFCEHYPWGSWSACTRTCAYGTQSRSRNIVYDEHYRTNNCDQLCTKHESRSCNEEPCAINCRLGDFGSWSDCDPCLKKQFRVRPLEQPSQFGGQSCNGLLSDSRPCIPTKLCNLEEADCTNKFKCGTGRCIDSKLKCNGDNDCGDNSDERGCPKKTGRIFEPVPGAQLMGNGYNYLSSESAGEIFDNSFYGGQRKIFYGNETGPNRKGYRLAFNLENFKLQEKNEEDDVVSDFYNSLNDFNKDIKTQDHRQSSGGSVFRIPILFSSKRNSRRTSSSSFKEAITSSYKKNSKFIRIHKVISVSEFSLKKDNLWLSDVFLKALNHLPLEYNYPLYSRIFDNFGTHYISRGSMGGLYDLLFQYSAEELKNSGMTDEESRECLRTEIVRRILFWKKKTVRESCTTNRMTVRYGGSVLESSEKSISFIKPGRAKFAAKLGYEKQGPNPENQGYEEWKASVVDNPIVVDFELMPIVDLIAGFPCAVTKRRNLLKAFNEYLERFDPCKCIPCPNNARTVLVDTECLCVCQPGTYGESCEKKAPDYKSIAADGSWNCWSSWSACDASRVRRRTRQCNNPVPRNGGKPCEGPDTGEDPCTISLFEDQGALCINDDEDKKEVDQTHPDPDSGCPKPEPPENGLFVNEKRWYKVAEEIEIMCFSGYELSGYQFVRCLPDGTWKQEDVKCVRTTCPRPAATLDVSISRFKSDYKVGEVINLSCPSGFTVTGETRYTCGSNYEWSPPIQGELDCEKELPKVNQDNCKPGQKKVGSECVCMSPEEDCRHYSEDLCLYDQDSDSEVTMPGCRFLAEKCLGRKRLHIIDNGPCNNVNLNWMRDRISLSSQSKKREACGYDFCYDWERCTDSQCFCLFPYQCPENNEQLFCIKTGSSGRKKTVNLCGLGAIKCSNLKVDVAHNGACTQ
ncbi:complement component C6 [Rana temporaria]|uniref:complement component C6 n=1 Tax=Rana temporaria TaxID=8407 RepID=UPI001AAC730E|nr:complement component C6 [Rana temporaria]